MRRGDAWHGVGKMFIFVCMLCVGVGGMPVVFIHIVFL